MSPTFGDDDSGECSTAERTHYDKAVELVENACKIDGDMPMIAVVGNMIAAAQVHATLWHGMHTAHGGN